MFSVLNYMPFLVEDGASSMAVLILHLALALGLGLLSTRLMKIIKLPNVTGYLLVGIVLGPYLLGKIKIGDFSFGLNNVDVKNLAVFSDIALGFIALTIGTSFKVDTLKKTGKKIIIITIFEGVIAMVMVIVVLLIVYLINHEIVPLPVILTLGAIASATAPAATLMVIRQYRARGPVVNTILPVVALDDAVALIAFAVFFSMAKVLANGGSVDVVTILLKPLIVIIASLVIGFGFGYLASFVCRFFKSRGNRLMILMFFIFLGVGISNITWWGTNFSSLLLCMMIGAAFINFQQNDGGRLLEQVDRWTPPLFMFFFILSGASLSFGNGGNVYLYIIFILYVLARVVGKFLGAYFGAKITNSDSITKKYLGWMLIPQAGVAIGLATQAQRTFPELVGPEFGTMTYGDMILFIILAATIIYEIIGPVVTKVALKKAGEIPEVDNLTPREKAEMAQAALKKVEKIPDIPPEKSAEPKVGVETEVQLQKI